MAEVYVNRQEHAVGFRVAEADAFAVDTFIKFMMDNNYWIKVDGVPETNDSIIWIKASEVKEN